MTEGPLQYHLVFTELYMIELTNLSSFICATTRVEDVWSPLFLYFLKNFTAIIVWYPLSNYMSANEAVSNLLAILLIIIVGMCFNYKVLLNPPSSSSQLPWIYLCHGSLRTLNERKNAYVYMHEWKISNSRKQLAST